MMKIQYASDLHLEFGANTLFLKQHPMRVAGEILVLAGDIGYLGDARYAAHPFWDWASRSYRQVIVIPGNHELYGGFDINELHEGWSLDIRDNVRCVYNTKLHLDADTDLIASTLWAHIPVGDAFITEKSVNDFYKIRNGKYRLSWERFNDEHRRCRKFIEESVAKSEAGNIVVVTHHVPSFELMADEFRGSSINGAFTTELGNFIANSRIRYWIYGHSHRNISKKIGDTECVSNQLGYVSSGEHTTFSPDACIEL